MLDRFSLLVIIGMGLILVPMAGSDV